MKNTDAAVINSVLAGNVNAFELLVKRYYKSIYAMAWSVVHDSMSAEDIAQEVFIAAFTRLSQLRDPAAFAPWLRRITANTARMWLRGQQSRELASNMGTLADTRTVEPGPIDEEIRAALNSLPKSKREVAVLCYMDGIMRKDAARFLGVNESTLRKRLHDAKKLLQKRIVEAAERNLEKHLLPRGFESRCICACERALDAKRKEVLSMTAKKKDCLCGCLPPTDKKRDKGKDTDKTRPKKNRPSKKSR
jgi:RNA polymerase sigma-70 factor (ECF subfamily)